MKTSNKLLIGMFLFILILIPFSIYLSFKKVQNLRSNIKYETLVIDKQIDSLIINLAQKSNVQISVGDSFLIKYNNDSKFKYSIIGKSLYLDNDFSIKLKVPDSISYVSVFAGKCEFYHLNQDSLFLKTLNLYPCRIIDSKIQNLHLELRATKFKLKNTSISSLDFDFKDYSVLSANNLSNIDDIQGIVDSTSSITIAGTRKINMNNNN